MNDDIILATLQGEPIVTVKSLQEEKSALLKSHPGINIPEDVLSSRGFERNLLEQVIGQKIADNYIMVNKINETEAYKKDLDTAIQNVIHQLNMKYFAESQRFSVSDDELKVFYDAKAKEDPQYVPFDQIKINPEFEKLKSMLIEEVEQAKRLEILNQEIEKLKEEYGVQINENYFKLHDAD